MTSSDLYISSTTVKNVSKQSMTKVFTPYLTFLPSWNALYESKRANMYFQITMWPKMPHFYQAQVLVQTYLNGFYRDEPVTPSLTSSWTTYVLWNMCNYWFTVFWFFFLPRCLMCLLFLKLFLVNIWPLLLFLFCFSKTFLYALYITHHVWVCLALVKKYEIPHGKPCLT